MEGVAEVIVPPVEVVPALVVGVTVFEELLGREVVGVLFEDDVEPLLDVPMLISKEHEPNKRVRKIKKGKLFFIHNSFYFLDIYLRNFILS